MIAPSPGPRTRRRTDGRDRPEAGLRSVAQHAAGGLLLLALTTALAAWSANGQEPPGAAPRDDPSRSCLFGSCHADRRTPGHLHRPVAEDACGICHRLIPGTVHDYRLAQSGSELCTKCHGEISMAGNVHSGVGRGDCLVCHDPHGTGNPFLLSSARVVDACESCHFDLLAGRSNMHLGVAAEPCTLCHDPHARDAAVALPDDEGLCLTCHASVRNDLQTRSHVHAPAQPGQCGLCHEGHRSDRPADLREPVPALCYACHDDVRETVQSAEHPHSVASEPDGCLVCHEPHASTLGFGLRSDPFTLCGTCHDQDVIAADGERIPAIAYQLQGRFLHGPVRQLDCGACHDSHGSDHFRLLVDAYPPDFYADFAVEKYGLCFSCHLDRGMLTPRTTELTDFRDGDLNLHYLHVARPRNGRTCRACHATHGSDAPKHMREWVAYGSWKLPISFEMTDTGGRCESGCHDPKSYDRVSPVNPTATGPAPSDADAERE